MAVSLPPSLDWAMCYSPVLLARVAGYTPDPWQQQFLRSHHPRILANIHRQGGKSLCCAIIALHTALYQPGSLVLMVSPSLRQSALLFRSALDLYRTLGKPVPPSIENRLSLELEGGSQIVSLPGSESTIRGYAGAALIIVDEAARVPDELLAAVRPMLATSGGRLIAPSTGAGRRGWWFTAWEQEGDTWERYEVPAVKCKRISAAFLAEERRALGPTLYSQEYENAFVAAEHSVFPEVYLQRIISDTEHAWVVPPPAWEAPTPAIPSAPKAESWKSEIKPVARDPRQTPYGVPWP